MELLRTRDINIGFFGVQLLFDVNLELQAGEIHCLCGENGAGKSKERHHGQDGGDERRKERQSHAREEPVWPDSPSPATVRGLGLRRMNQTVVLADTPEIRGMLNASRHLLRVEEA